VFVNTRICNLIARLAPLCGLLICFGILNLRSAAAADYQVIDILPGQTVDVYFEINLSGTVTLRIATKAGPGCAELWWIRWPLGDIKSLGKRCGSVRLALPGFSDFAIAGKLRATGVNVPTKIVAAANERVANTVPLNW
jgi:hypothetical protein